MKRHAKGKAHFMKRGHTWEGARNGRKYKTMIGGSHHGDLRVTRTDETWDQTIDPFGQSVSYKPVTSAGRKRVSPYHSTEPILLAAALRYVRQEHIDIDFLTGWRQAFA